MSKPLSKRVLGVVLQQLILILQEAQSDNPPVLGICTSLDDRILLLGETDQRWCRYDTSQAISNWLKGAFASWPEYSGCRAYPIKPTLHSTGGLDYMLSGTGKYRWSTDNPYGRARLRLLSHVIERAAAELCAGRTRTENQQRKV